MKVVLRGVIVGMPAYSPSVQCDHAAESGSIFCKFICFSVEVQPNGSSKLMEYYNYNTNAFLGLGFHNQYIPIMESNMQTIKASD